MKAETSRAMDHYMPIAYSKWCFLDILKLQKTQKTALILLGSFLLNPTEPL